MRLVKSIFSAAVLGTACFGLAAAPAIAAPKKVEKKVEKKEEKKEEAKKEEKKCDAAGAECKEGAECKAENCKKEAPAPAPAPAK